MILTLNDIRLALLKNHATGLQAEVTKGQMTDVEPVARFVDWQAWYEWFMKEVAPKMDDEAHVWFTSVEFMPDKFLDLCAQKGRRVECLPK